MRFLSISLPIILAVILAVLPLMHLAGYPMPPEGIAAEKYEGFSGVLTIAVETTLSEDFPRLQRWLNEITNLFEKSNRGVYLRCVEIAPDGLDSATQGIQPADIVLGRAGLLRGGNWRENEIPSLLPAFSGSETAVAVAAGGYVLGFRGEPPASLDLLPDRSIGWNDGLSTVLVALCERFSPISTPIRRISTPDIGLMPADTPLPTAEPAAGTKIARKNLFKAEDTALFQAFLDGDLRAMPLNEAQVARISALQADGKHPDIRFLNAAAYTDRVVYAAIPRSGRADADERAAEAQRFIGFMLSDASQQRLAKYGLFPTAMVESVHSPVPGMNMIEEALRRSDCVVQGTALIDFDAFLDGQVPARELMRRLRNTAG